MFQDFRGDDPVKGVVGERQAGGVTIGCLQDHPLGYLTVAVHHGTDGPYLAELVEAQIAGHYVSPPAQRLVSVAAAATAPVEHPLSRPQAAALVVGVTAPQELLGGGSEFGLDTLAGLAFMLPFMACAYFLLLGLLAELAVKASDIHSSERSSGGGA